MQNENFDIDTEDVARALDAGHKQLDSKPEFFGVSLVQNSDHPIQELQHETDTYRRDGLTVRVVNGQLVIAIGIDALVYYAQPENAGPIGACRVDPDMALEWAEDLAFELEKMDDLLNTPLTRLMDAAMVDARDRGSDAVVYPDQYPF